MLKQNPRILLLGDTGQLGWELARSLSVLGDVCAVRDESGNRFALDDPPALMSQLERVRPDVLVNAAAYTAVDAAEDDRSQAACINAELPKVLGAHCAQTAALLVHYSTDYVFSGEKANPYIESDLPAPVNVYGETKYAGEQAITESGCRALVFRTSWVYSTRRKNFFLTMLRLLNAGQDISVVNDQIGAPTSARALADATSSILAQAKSQSRHWLDERLGLYHLSAAEQTSWFGFTEAIAADLYPQGYPPGLRAISSEDYPVRAARPKNSVLDNSAVRSAFNITLPDWRTQLRHTLADWRAWGVSGAREDNERI